MRFNILKNEITFFEKRILPPPPFGNNLIFQNTISFLMVLNDSFNILFNTLK